MWRKQLVNLRILVVEDYMRQRRNIISDLEDIPPSTRQKYSISDFHVDEAGCLEEGLAMLHTALSRSSPYHLVLLDLGMPLKPQDNTSGHDLSSETETENGFEILKFINENGGAMSVIIVSVFSTHEFVRKGFQAGAVDFIAKPFKTEALQTLALDAWMRLLRRESNPILQQRVKDLIPHLKNGLTHYFTAPFSKLLLSVSDIVDKIEEYAKERYGLDSNRDAENPLMQNLRLQKEALTEARIEWKNQQDVLGTGDNLPQIRRVEAMLRHLNRTLLPCLTVKRTNLNIQIPKRSDTRAITFQNDVYAVLKEVILGGISDLPDSEEVSNFTVTIEPAEDIHVVVRFEDDLKPVSEKAADAINKGLGIIHDQSLGREWGLSIAQHIAKRGGGHLEIKPQKVMGNIITCKFQVAHYA